jgi:hypothetical protein
MDKELDFSSLEKVLEDSLMWRLMRRDIRTGNVYWLQDRLHKDYAVAMWEAETKRHEEDMNVQFWIEPDVSGVNFD